MLNVNTEILIHQNFKKGLLGPQPWKIFPRVPVPLGIILETIRISPGVFINSNHKLFGQFIGKIQNTTFLELIRDSLLFLAVPLFVLCMVREDAPTAVLNLFQYTDPRARPQVRQFVSLYQIELKETLEDATARMGLLKDMHGFWVIFLRQRDAIANAGVSVFRGLMEPLPPHLPAHFITKLGLCSFYSDHNELVSELQGLHFPRLGLLTEHKRICIPTAIFSELMSAAGVSMRINQQQQGGGGGGGGAAGFLTEFRSAVWETHIRTPPKLLQLPIQPVHMEFTNQEILCQVLCFMLPNWAQVWNEMGWPFTFEIQRRLRFLKQQSWRPKCKEFITLILNAK